MGIKRGGWVCTVCRKKERHVINQQLIAMEEELKERNPRQAYRMVQKVKYGGNPHTGLCKGKRGNNGIKEQIKGKWKEHIV